MGFKLFKSDEDKMQDTMFGQLSPKGRDILKLLGSITDGVSDPFYFADYEISKTYNTPQYELTYLAAELKSMNIGLALCEQTGVFFADPARVIKFKDEFLKLIESDERNLSDDYPWLLLLNSFWKNRIPIANILIFMEGFEVTSFVDGEKIKKVFVKKPLDTF